MPLRPIRSALAGAVIIALGLCACGGSDPDPFVEGSDPPKFAEVRFEVRPAGQATFRVDSLVGGGVSHASVVGQEFSATSTFAFVLENAAPPFGGSFTLTSGEQITVTLTRISDIAQTQVSDVATAPGSTASVVIGGPLPALPGPANPEVRFDVCAALPGQSACSTITGMGSFGVQFSGTVGDPLVSYLFNGATPSIYFFEGARDNVNAVFTRQPMTGDLLVVGLSINGAPVQTQADSGDVILRRDL